MFLTSSEDWEGPEIMKDSRPCRAAAEAVKLWRLSLLWAPLKDLSISFGWWFEVLLCLWLIRLPSLVADWVMKLFC